MIQSKGSLDLFRGAPFFVLWVAFGQRIDPILALSLAFGALFVWLIVFDEPECDLSKFLTDMEGNYD